MTTTTARPRIEDRGDLIIIRGDLGDEIAWGSIYSSTEGSAEFKELFEIDPTEYLGDPKDDFYQGITFTQIIRRKSDGAAFGVQLWNSPGNDSVEGTILTDPDDYIDDEMDPDTYEYPGGMPYVFVRVNKFMRPGYTLREDLKKETR